MRLFLILLYFLPSVALANDWDAFKQDGAIAIMRHALAPGTGDPLAFELGDCSTQRNLDDRGRAQAGSIGAAFEKRGIRFETVFTSQWCRTRETADLLDLGPVVEAPSLNSFFRDRSTRETQTKETRRLISKAAGRLMLVTHQVNISALTGQTTRSGEVLVIRIVDGGIEVLGRVLIDP